MIKYQLFEKKKILNIFNQLIFLLQNIIALGLKKYCKICFNHFSFEKIETPGESKLFKENRKNCSTKSKFMQTGRVLTATDCNNIF
jgi:hypothetical protein